MATKTFYTQSGGFSSGACLDNSGYCSGRSSSTAMVGGNSYATSETAGDLTNKQFQLASGETNVTSKPIECRPAVAAWAAGTYAVTVNVTTANMNLTLTEIHLCRVSSACGAVSTIGSLTGIARGLGSTGSVTHNVTGAADTNGSTDKLMVLMVFSNAAMSGQSANAEVTIATPIEEASEPTGAKPGTLVIRQAVMRATLH